ncbi:MAG: hypothetical protein ACYCXY_03605 [Acidimicrobiales bacterium]
MHGSVTGALVVATVNKHHLAGLVGIAVGVLLVVLGGLRVFGRTVRSMLVPVVGLVVVGIGLLLYFRVV